MNAVITLILGFVGIAVGYGVYAKTINKNIVKPDEKKSKKKR